ncbi:hypothetical protein CE11_00953 [Megavirus courdo11]|uniref:Transmembrane protein n=3 Tax=Megavirus chilense TaxID=3060301 RepID=L7XZG7_9VIRU|nr:hypothetical protein MegaChil _gp0873 [Megavirus chiliensis]AEQ32856.1 putative transmembrane domain protein [Megavirus chiliensis]AFX92979.1 hypothetical protein CE11_00953 [Megavirus courdo11]AGD92830.1 hypothetical protein LBA_00912 [Megavirus lba]
MSYNNIPNCLTIPSITGSTTNCVNVQFPSLSTIVLIIIFYWIIYLIVAYAIYYFLNKMYPGQRVNYWIILLVLLLSGLILSLISRL